MKYHITSQCKGNKQIQIKEKKSIKVKYPINYKSNKIKSNHAFKRKYHILNMSMSTLIYYGRVKRQKSWKIIDSYLHT